MSIKILLCNIAIRTRPDQFPPVACTSLINFLKKHGYEAEFFDIDVKRPSDVDLFKYFREKQFDLVGISAVVSTGYAFTKKLAMIIKQASPSTQIIVGGNLAAASEVLLKKCAVDLCAIGEGEKILLDVVKYLEEHKTFLPARQELKFVRGIAFLDVQGQVVVTDPVELVEIKDISQPDYDLLKQHSEIEHYLPDGQSQHFFAYDQRSLQPHRYGKKMATILTSKGCINRCTFCHRWIRGYRVLPVEKVIATMQQLKEEYNIGFFSISDECFGEDSRWLEEFIRRVKPLDILFVVGGARVSIVKRDETVIRRLKEVGLTTVIFGMESGCDKILAVMEKKVTREDNLRASKICAEVGVWTTIQLVIGMPGENDKTINETIDFVNQATSGLPYLPSLSINYLQALPGTPSYDFLKLYKMIGDSIEDEEKYLLKVSDLNAGEFRHYINVTEASLPRVRMWSQKILVSAKIAWLKKHGWRFPDDWSGDVVEPDKLRNKIKISIKKSPLTYRFIDILGDFFWSMLVLKNVCQLYGACRAMAMLLGIHKEDRTAFQIDAVSLRKIVGPPINKINPLGDRYV